MSENTQLVVDLLRRMSNRTLDNYILPGISSSMVGGDGFGTVRLLESERNHEETIVPHSHRFDFQCLVLSGHVENTIWRPGLSGDEFMASSMIYGGAPGKYETVELSPGRFTPKRTMFAPGEWYGMSHDEIHSIKFSRGAMVLFLEGPPKTQETVMLQPFVNGLTIPTMKTEPWMFRPRAAVSEGA